MKLLAFTLVLLLSGTEAFANMSSDNIRTEVRCIEGVKVLFTWAAYSATNVVTAVQLMEKNKLSARGELPLQPMRCDK